MSLTVTLVNSSTTCLDVRWSSSASSASHSFYLVNVASSDTAAGHEWTVVVRDSKMSAIHLDLERSGMAGTPLITVKRCVTRSVLGDEHRIVEEVGINGVSSTAASAADTGRGGVYDRLGWLFRLLSFSSGPSTPLGDNFILVVAYWLFPCLHSQCLLVCF